jgi:hypothetical protein
MSSVENQPISTKAAANTCPHCGASIEPADAICWLCLAPVGQVPAGRNAAAQVVPRMPPLSTGNYSLASLMMFMTLVAVVLGVATQWPGLGIPLGIVSLILWSRTVGIVRDRAKQGLEVSPLQKILIFMSSFAMTMVVLGLVIVTGAAALGAACAAIFTVGDTNGEAFPWLVGLSLLAIGGLISLTVIIRAINRRNARRRV